jgi:hypothetical protein
VAYRDRLAHLSNRLNVGSASSQSDSQVGAAPVEFQASARSAFDTAPGGRLGCAGSVCLAKSGSLHFELMLHSGAKVCCWHRGC